VRTKKSAKKTVLSGEDEKSCEEEVVFSGEDEKVAKNFVRKLAKNVAKKIVSSGDDEDLVIS